MASRRLVRRGVILPLVVVLAVGGSVAAWASTATVVTGYRTARVTTGSVEQLLTLTGKVAVVRQRRAAFPVVAEVATVSVRAGDTVAAGEKLATLDTTALSAAVTKATAALAAAKAALETDSTSSTSSSNSTSSAGSTSSTSSASGTASAAQAAQQVASKALRAAAEVLAAAQRACAPTAPAATASPTQVPAPTTTAGPTQVPATTASSTPAPAGSTSGAQPCSDALARALAAQQRAASAQQALSQAQSQLSVALAHSGGTNATSTAGSEGVPARSTAAQLTTDAAAVQAAQVGLDATNVSLAAATLRSPIAGTVASMPYVVGQRASASDAVVVIGAGAVMVTVDVPLASIRQVKVGQPARVTADGATTSAVGTVAAISLLPTSSTTTTYPVTLLVPRPGKAFADGASAGVSVVTKVAKGSVTVPNSAVQTVGGASTVLVLKAGTATRTRIGTGALGELVTQVTSGLQVGQEVVLADLSQQLPTSSTAASTRGFGSDGGPPAGSGFTPGSGPPAGLVPAG